MCTIHHRILLLFLLSLLLGWWQPAAWQTSGVSWWLRSHRLGWSEASSLTGHSECWSSTRTVAKALCLDMYPWALHSPGLCDSSWFQERVTSERARTAVPWFSPSLDGHSATFCLQEDSCIYFDQIYWPVISFSHNVPLSGFDMREMLVS